jgi:hypothetical protein
MFGVLFYLFLVLLIFSRYCLYAAIYENLQDREKQNFKIFVMTLLNLFALYVSSRVWVRMSQPP